MQARKAVKISAILALAALLFATAPALFAQTEMSPPQVLVAYHGRLKPGHEMAAGKAATAIRDAYARANWPTHYISTWAMTGHDVAVILVPYPSFEAWEKDNYAQMGNATMFAAVNKAVTEWSSQMDDVWTVAMKYRADLSYHPNLPVKGVRYFDVIRLEMRAGRGGNFEELEKKSIAAHEKAGIDEHWAVFQVVSGAPFGTLVYFSPEKSLSEWDKVDEMHGKNFADAMGGEDAMKKFEAEMMQAIGEASDTLLVIDPTSSYPLKDWKDADPAFWNMKPPGAMMKKPASKKEAAPKE